MERGVYIATMSDVTEISAVDSNGAVLKRVSLPTHLFTQREVDEVSAFLSRVSERPVALRLV